MNTQPHLTPSITHPSIVILTRLTSPTLRPPYPSVINPTRSSLGNLTPLHLHPSISSPIAHTHRHTHTVLITLSIHTNAHHR